MLQVITCTGARPFAWSLCQKYMARQDYTGRVRWIIVDDGPIASARPVTRWPMTIIRPAELWSPGMRTNCRNLALAMDECDPDQPTCFVEDDDWYSPGYLSQVADVMQRETLAGQATCAKFNVKTRRYRFHSHPHASLCCTAVRGEHFHRLREIIKADPKLPDLPLWRSGGGKLYGGLYVVGMKGLPGRAGIDSGHAMTYVNKRDPAKLRQWIGNDSESYIENAR